MKQSRFRKSRYFYGMLVKFLLPLFVSITLLGSLGTFVGYNYLKSELGYANQTLLETTLYNTELMLSELDSLILAFDVNPSIINQCYHILNTESFGYKEHTDLKYIETYFNAPVNARQYMDSIYLYYPNPYNRYLASNNRGSILGDGFQDGWYESYLDHRDTMDTWSEVYYSEKRGKEIIAVYQMMDYGGVVVLNLDAKYMKEVVEASSVFEGQSIYVLNQQGEPLLQIGKPYEENKDIRKKDVVYQMDSVRYHWTYLSVTPQAEFYQLPILIMRYTMILLAFITVVGIGVAYMATRSSYRNFENLQDIIEAARNGTNFDNYEVRESSDYLTYLTRQMVQNFIEQDFLKVQLSERKYKLRSMELLAMQSQMNPHFLYNTLETMNWKIMEAVGKRTSVNDMVENLSEILIYSLDLKHEYAALEKEVYITKCYTAILQERYGGQFEVKWQYETDILKKSIVKFVLQPLVENAVNHGIREKEGSSGKIKIKIYPKGQMLNLTVLDNGAGISKEKLKELREGLRKGISDSSHIGIFNTNKRLKLAYGDAYGISIRSREGEGTAVTVMIPMSNGEVENAKDDT